MNKEAERLPNIWVLTDEVAGHNAQSIGVAEALGLPFIKKKIIYNKKAKLPNFLICNDFSSVDSKKSDSLHGNPDIVISCGRKLAPVALAIKKRAKKAKIKTYTCHIMWCGLSKFFGFDLVALPSHDNINFLIAKNKRILKTIGAPNRINKDFLLQEYKIWGRTIGELPKPRIVVLIGGNSRKTNFTKYHSEILVNRVTNIVSELGASLLVTNSRRTNPELSDYIKAEFKHKIGRYYYFHDVHQSKANPFFAFLQLADCVITTGDSISMCSEACTIGKPVFIFSPDGNAPPKHRRFHELLYKGGYASEFNDDNIRKIISSKNLNSLNASKILNTASLIADRIRNDF
ncbi:MAG: ELM1/GtrOC1 family putative glycosyltransferase [Rickettsiales bacterium]|nr:ELM1/GtrOC1 family putative glycosyltransferase [Rickettsiales bacterium]